MPKRVFLRLVLALALLGALVPLSPGAAARPEQIGPRAAFNRLQARSNSALWVNWDARSDAPDFLTGRDPAARLPYQPTAAELGNPVAIARGFLDENRALFKLRGVAEELRFLRNETDKQLGWSHVRLAQVYQGLPVFGYQLVVHLDTQNQVVTVNGPVVLEEGADYICGDIIRLEFSQDTTGAFFVDVFVNDAGVELVGMEAGGRAVVHRAQSCSRHLLNHPVGIACRRSLSWRL